MELEQLDSAGQRVDDLNTSTNKQQSRQQKVPETGDSPGDGRVESGKTDAEDKLENARNPGSRSKSTQSREADSQTNPKWSPIQKFRRFWNEYISPTLTVAAEDGSVVHDHRDFLALERTQLAHLRSGNALALLGVSIAQLYIISTSNTRVGIGLSITAYSGAILMTGLSCARFLRQQHLIIHGRVISAGPDMMLIWFIFGTVCFSVFIAILVVA